VIDMRCIDADALEKEGWSLHRTIRVDKHTEEYQTKPLKQVPTIEPQRKKGRWIEHNPHKWGLGIVFECSECGEKIDCEPSNFCPNCGADMRTPVEIARDIVHEAINNSVWSDTVDTAKMHKAVDDKYAEIRGDANADAES
jgi:hypothetical protein